MTEKEFAKMMSFVMAAIEKKPSKQTIEVYYEMLKDLPFDLAFAAAKKVIAQDEYPVLPTIGKLRKAAQDLCYMDKLSAPEAWGRVLQAVRRHGSYGEEEALQELPPEIALVVKWMGWREICFSNSPDVVRAQFMRMYETQILRQKEIDFLPEGVKVLLKDVGDKLKLPDGKASRGRLQVGGEIVVPKEKI